MLLCNNCGAENGDESNYCESCGATLPPKPSARKRLMQTMLVRPPAPKPAPPKRTAATVTVALLDGKRFVLRGNGAFGVGRADGAMGWHPAVDLAQHGGEPGGVSRRHAQIDVINGKAYVIDMDSSNGTKLNGCTVAANTRHALRTGDELLFGRVLARIEIA